MSTVTVEIDSRLVRFFVHLPFLWWQVCRGLVFPSLRYFCIGAARASFITAPNGSSCPCVSQSSVSSPWFISGWVERLPRS